jgi:hypothetical protein
MRFRPYAQSSQRFNGAEAFRGQRVFHAYRYLGEYLTADESGAFETTEIRCQHFGRDAFHAPLQFAETHRPGLQGFDEEYRPPAGYDIKQFPARAVTGIDITVQALTGLAPMTVGLRRMTLRILFPTTALSNIHNNP